MTDSVQLSDQFLLASSLKTDSETLISKGKNVVYVSDINQGSYQSGLITVDATNQLNGSQGFASLREGYLTVPYVITARNSGTTTLASRLSRFACSLKTGVWNVISDLEVELNGKQVLTTNQYKNFWNNLRAMTEYGVGDLQKHGADAFLQPDDWFSINFASGPVANGDGYSNNSVDITQNLDATLGHTQEHRACNDGFFKRLCSSTPMILDSSEAQATFNWPSLHAKAQRQMIQQAGRGCFIESNGAATAGNNAGTWIYILKIRLTDLHPLFKELDLMANPQIKLRYKVNCGTVELLGAASSSMSLVSSTLTSGETCPIMVASCATNNPMNGVLAAGDKISFSFGALRNAFTETATIGSLLPYSTTRLHIPFYDIEDPRPIISKPVKTVRYLDCFAQYFRTGGGVGVKDDGQQNAGFNYQINASLKNLKYVALIPFAETSAGHWTTAHGTEQFASPFDSAPWTCQAGALVRNFQVQVGNKNVFAKTHEYDYESFMDEFSKLAAINGDNTREMSNGLIDIDKWSFAQRILVADCSRITQKDVPAAIQVSGVNACSQGSRYLILCVYERELSYDRLTGEVEFFN